MPSFQMPRWVGTTIIVKNNLPKLTPLVKANARVAIAHGCQLVADDARYSMASPHATGRLYRRGRKWHQASAPGEPPAVDTGRLLNAFGIGFQSQLTGYVRVSTDYAVHLEMGTVHMAARPFLVPALERHRTRIVNYIQQAVWQGANGVAL